MVTGRNVPAAILFDWGETLVQIPGMIHSAERHLDCVEKMYCEADGESSWVPAMRYGATWIEFRAAYLAAASRHMAWSAETRREHSFEARLADAIAGVGLSRPPAAELAELVTRLGNHIIAEAVVVDGAQEVIAALAERYRLGVVSNYPYPPVVARTLERFGIRRFFSGLVVSGEFGWLKPHPDVYLEALRRMGAQPQRTLFVGDDLHNDVKGPKALGLRTAWFAPGKRRNTDPDIDVQIADLRELLVWCRDNLEPWDTGDDWNRNPVADRRQVY